MTNHGWEQALDWASQQSIDVKFTLPDPVSGEEEASQKQLQYIRSIVRDVDESTLQKLTKRQACSLIDEIDGRKKAFAKSKAKEYLKLHPRGAKPSSLVLLVIVVIGVMVVIGGYMALSQTGRSAAQTPSPQSATSQSVLPQTAWTLEPASVPDNFIEEHQTLYAQITRTTFAKMPSGGSIHLRPGDLVLVTARDSKFVRIELNGKPGTIPISSTNLEAR
jgi:hypothetical protein